MAEIDDDNKSATIKIPYWGPFKSGKTTSNAYVRSRMTGTAFEPDDDPFLPCFVAACEALPISVVGGVWRSPPFSKLGGYDLVLEFHDFSGFPVSVAMRSGWEHSQPRVLGLSGADAIIFVASSAEEDLAANVESLEELRSRGLLSFTAFQFNKSDVESALSPEVLAQELGIERQPYASSLARNGSGVIWGVQAAVQLALERLSKSGG